jgi:hypothetical protein
MATTKLAPGPQITKDKAGRTLYWIDRKRVKESVYWNEIALLKEKVDAEATIAVHPINLAVDSDFIEIDFGSGTARTVIANHKIHSTQSKPEPQLPVLPPVSSNYQSDSVLDQLDALLLEVRRFFQPTTTAKERNFLALCQIQESGYHAGYAEALAVAGSPMAANAFIGSLQRKGLIRYESKEEARYRLISTENRFYHLTSSEVQQARIIEPTFLGTQIGNAQLQAELTSVH